MKENNFPTLIKSLWVLHIALVVCGYAVLFMGIAFGKDLFIATLNAIGVNLGILCLGQGFAISKWSENGHVANSTTTRTETLSVAKSADPVVPTGSSDVPREGA